jgi:hypothetical protein
MGNASRGKLYRCYGGGRGVVKRASPFRVGGFLWCDEMAESLIAGGIRARDRYTLKTGIVPDHPFKLYFL